MKKILYILSFTLFQSIFSQIQLGEDIDGNFPSTYFGSSVSMSSDGNRIAIGTNYKSNTGVYGEGHVKVYEYNGINWIQLGQVLNGNQGHNFGVSVALSDDGTRLAIGAIGNISNSTNPNGQVLIYDLIGNNWTQIGQTITGEYADDRFGISVSLSSDSNRIAIGAHKNDYNGTDSGHVKVYDFNSTLSEWVQIGTNINGDEEYSDFGHSISLSSNGNNLAIGAYGNQNNSGYVRIYEFSGGNWMQQGNDIDGENLGDNFGWAVSLSGNGDRIAVGAINNDSNGDYSGYTRIFDYNGSDWFQVGSNIVGESQGDWSGYSVSISDNGLYLAIGAPWNDETGDMAGHARIYHYDNTDWLQIGNDINGEAQGDWFGRCLSLSSDASKVLISGPSNDGNGSNSGHVRVYDLSNLLSIDDKLLEDNILVYPNPTQDKVFIKGKLTNDMITLEILDIKGKMVKKTKLIDSIIELSDLQSGFYYLKFRSNENSVIRPIIKL